MILSHYLFNRPISFEEQTVQRMVFENPSDFGKFVHEIHDQTRGLDGHFFLSEDNIELDISRRVNLIVDPFSIDINTKDILSGFYKQVIFLLESGDDYPDFRDAVGSLLEVVSRVSSDVESSATVDELAALPLLKIISLNILDSDNICENICDYVRLSSSYASKRLSILVNLDMFLSKDDYAECLRQLRYCQVNVLLMESSVKDDVVPTKLFDTSFCELDF